MDTRVAAPPATIEVEDGGGMVSVTWSDGTASRFPAIWLADNRPAGRRGREGQRLGDALELPENVTVTRATPAVDGVEIAFSCFEQPVLFDAGWLRDHALDPASRAVRRRRAIELWNGGLAAQL